MSVRHFAARNADWYQFKDKRIFVGDVLDASNSETMSVGFYRNERKGERNEWIVTYDEALIVTKGALTVRSAEGATTAKPGEVIFLTKGTEVAYEAAEDGTEVVYVTFPHWMDTHRRSQHARLLDAYHPATP
jgi:ethanolamine utilization protein EutQ